MYSSFKTAVFIAEVSVQSGCWLEKGHPSPALIAVPRLMVVGVTQPLNIRMSMKVSRWARSMQWLWLGHLMSHRQLALTRKEETDTWKSLEINYL